MKNVPWVSTRRSLHAIFDGNTCRSCTILERCPVRAPNHRGKSCKARDTTGDFRLEITPEIRLRDQMYTLQQTAEWKDRYKIRAGIEATNSELKRAHGIGRLRVRRLARVCFAVVCKLIACTIKRWAKASFSLKRFLKGCIAPFYVCVIAYLLRIIGDVPERMVQQPDILYGVNNFDRLGNGGYFSGIIVIGFSPVDGKYCFMQRADGLWKN